MKVSYKKLWKLLVDNEMTKTEFRLKIGISTNTLTKLSKSEVVGTEILMKICKYFNCDVGDIIEFINEDDVKGDL